jgi:iron complex outermembrane receptor protein
MLLYRDIVVLLRHIPRKGQSDVKHFRLYATCLLIALAAANAAAQAQTTSEQKKEDERVFILGEIVNVVGTQDIGIPGIGGAVISSEQSWKFDRSSLEQAINLAPGVSSTLDGNGRRNESDIFVRGFGRWQVPLMVDGVRIYLPADNRLDFGRFLTSDIAAVQIQKGYASVIDGPGAMGGAINLVTRRPVKKFESETGLSIGGRTAREAWSGYTMLGTRQKNFYAQAGINYSDRNFSTLSGAYTPSTTSLQPAGVRQSSDSNDWRINAKVGYTPNAKNEYTFNYMRQEGEKGAPVNVFNNPPVPPNSFWRWPWWNLQNFSFLSNTQLGDTAYVKGKVYYNTFDNGLDAYDTIAYTTQSANGRFRSVYADYAYGTGIEFGSTHFKNHVMKGAFHHRTDVHTEYQDNRPTSTTARTIEPKQRQSQYTWSVALEDTIRIHPTVDLVGGISYDKYQITKAQEYNTTASIFEYPKGGSDSVNWQAALMWQYNATGRLHFSVSDRTRFPVIFELYSTRFGTATPNPNLGPERGTNFEVGWRKDTAWNVSFTGSLFYSDVRDLIQTVQLPNATTQTQNVGNGHFYGAETSAEAKLAESWRAGGNYTYIRRIVKDALQPLLRPTGVPTQKAFFYLTWSPIQKLNVTPSLELADNRWSDKTTTPAQAFPYVKTGAYNLLMLDATYQATKNVAVSIGAKNLSDDNYQLAWGLPQAGRTFYLKTKTTF